MILTGATYTMSSGGRRVMTMCVREMVRNNPNQCRFSQLTAPHARRNYREYVGRVERAKTGTHAATATVAAVRRTLATAVITVAAAAAMFSSQRGHGRGTDGGRREGREDGKCFERY